MVTLYESVDKPRGRYKTYLYNMDTQYKYHRQSIRLKNYDYSSNGAYFVTICTTNREMLFGDVVNGKMITNKLGNLVNKTWESLSDRFPVIIDTYQIMPNHFHGIIIIDNSVGVPLVGTPPLVGAHPKRAGINPAPTLGNIIGAMVNFGKEIFMNTLSEMKLN